MKNELIILIDGKGQEYITGLEDLQFAWPQLVASTGKCEFYTYKMQKHKNRKPTEKRTLRKIYDVKDLNEYIRKGLEDGTIRRKPIK